jgi:hypothetical protein
MHQKKSHCKKLKSHATYESGFSPVWIVTKEGAVTNMSFRSHHFFSFITYSLLWCVAEVTLKGQLRGLHRRQSTHFMFQSTSNCFQWSKDVRLQIDLTSSRHPKVQNPKLDSFIFQLSTSFSFLSISLLKSLLVYFLLTKQIWIKR